MELTSYPRTWEIVFNSALHDLLHVHSYLLANRPFVPPAQLLFRAFELTPLPQVKVVLVGQDPYPQPGVATGLSFSVSPGVKIPSSLQNVCKELQRSIPGFTMPLSGDLTSWAQQGVLCLNISLSTAPNQPKAHAGIWGGFIYHIIKTLVDPELSGLKHLPIFVLWGRDAEKLSEIIGTRAPILTAPHPSGANRSGGFIGCNHFVQINNILTQRGQEPIDWRLL